MKLIKPIVFLILLVLVVHFEENQANVLSIKDEPGTNGLSSYCFQMGSYCDDYTPCCSGLDCASKKCCSTLGGACNSPYDCCPGSNITCGPTNTCTACSGAGSDCTQITDCCQQGVLVCVDKPNDRGVQYCLKVCSPGLRCGSDADCCGNTNNVCVNHICV